MRKQKPKPAPVPKKTKPRDVEFSLTRDEGERECRKATAIGAKLTVGDVTVNFVGNKVVIEQNRRDEYVGLQHEVKVDTRFVLTLPPST